MALVVGALISTATIAVQAKLDRDAAARAEHLAAQAELAAQQRDDLRFVREVASRPGTVSRPFDGLDLTDANISGLPLGCEVPGASDCARFVNASMARVSAVGADLRGSRFQAVNAELASFSMADLRGSFFDVADITGTNFDRADLRGASFGYATIRIDGADPSFQMADLRGTRFATDLSPEVEGRTGLDELIVTTNLGDWGFKLSCWDSTTVWPAGFEPPPSNPDACRPD